VASSNGHVQVVELLLKVEKRKKDQELLLKASAKGDVETVRELLKSGDADIDGRDSVCLLW
jgi:hypothetical protein